MFVLDTDHLSLMEWSENAARQQLLDRLSTVPPNQVFTTIITYEEQTRGWMAYSAAARTTARQVEAYRKLERHLGLYRRVQVLGFDEAAATEFERLKQSRIRIGTMDLKIAAIALARGATVLTRNLRDFRQVPGLKVEDWTV